MGLYYLCSENKGADQLRGYCEADLRLCFRKCKKLAVFSRRGSCLSPLFSGFLSLTIDWAVQPQKMVRGLLYCIKEVKALY